MKTLSRSIFALVLLAFCSCTKTESPANSDAPLEPQGDFRFTASVSSDIATWSRGDKMGAYTFSAKTGEYTQYGNLSTSGKTAFFAGDAPEKSGNLYLFYPALEGNGNNMTLDLSVQTGALDSSKNWLTSGKIEYVSGEEIKPVMTSVPFLVKAIVSFPIGVSGKITDLKLSGYGLSNKGNYKIHYGEFENLTDGDICISGEYDIKSSESLTLYIYLFPKKYSLGLTLSASVGGKTYSGTLLSKGTYTAGTSLTARASLELPKENNSKYKVKDGKFYIDNNEFFIKGVCLNGSNIAKKDKYYQLAADCGANVVRTYSYVDLGEGDGSSPVIRSNIKALKDLGIYVDFGIPIDVVTKTSFTDNLVYNKALTTAKDYIDKLSQCDNIIMWNIGNEMENGAKINSANLDACWELINEIAEYVKIADPLQRPTTTTLAGYGEAMYNDCLLKCPSLDFISINSYDPNVEKLHSQLQANPKYVASGKPYCVTEYGPVGTWETSCPRTSWGVNSGGLCTGVIEGSSAEKAADFKRIAKDYLEANKNKGCIGGFAFLLGWQSHGAVATYYAMVDDFEDYALEQTDALAEAFGKTVAKKAPTIKTYKDLKINNKTADQSLVVSPGASLNAVVSAVSNTGVVLSYDWYIVKDQNMTNGGNGMSGAELVVDNPLNNSAASVSLTAPTTTGIYRVLCYARDDTNRKAALATFPFKVN